MDDKEKASLVNPILPQIFSLLRDCLLGMKWQNALKVLQEIARKPAGVSTTVWRVGFRKLGIYITK